MWRGPTKFDDPAWREANAEAAEDPATHGLGCECTGCVEPDRPRVEAPYYSEQLAGGDYRCFRCRTWSGPGRNVEHRNDRYVPLCDECYAYPVGAMG